MLSRLTICTGCAVCGRWMNWRGCRKAKNDMDEILRRLTAIEALLYTITGLMLVMVTVFFALWSIVIQGRRPNIPQLFDLTTKAVKRGIYSLDVKLQKRRKKPKDKDLQPLPVPFDEVGFRQFCRELLQKIADAGGSMEGIELTEDAWSKYPRKKYVEFRTRLEEKGIVRIVDGRGTRGWWQSHNGSYATARERLERLAK